MLRKTFLAQLQRLIQRAHHGHDQLARSGGAPFFGRCCAARRRSKGAPLSELDHNLLAKQVEGVFDTTIRHRVAVGVAHVVPEVENEVIERRFTPEEARRSA